MSFYFYESWSSVGHKAEIHAGDCLHCQDGKGIKGSVATRNGRWSPAFESFDDASVAAKRTGADVRICSTCSPGPG